MGRAWCSSASGPGQALHAGGQLIVRDMPVSATLAANEAMAARRRRGQPVLPLAFGEAGLPVHPALRDALAAAAANNSFGPVAGHPALRSAAAGYWQRRGLPTRPDAVVCGPGSKAQAGPGHRTETRCDPPAAGYRRAGRAGAGAGRPGRPMADPV